MRSRSTEAALDVLDGDGGAHAVVGQGLRAVDGARTAPVGLEGVARRGPVRSPIRALAVRSGCAAVEGGAACGMVALSPGRDDGSVVDAAAARGCTGSTLPAGSVLQGRICSLAYEAGSAVVQRRAPAAPAARADVPCRKHKTRTQRD